MRARGARPARPGLSGPSLAVALALSAAGCALQTVVDERAVQAVPASFAGPVRPDLPRVVSSAAFWAAFGSPELASLVREAEAGSLDVAQAVARVRQAAAGTDVALSAFLPSGGGSAARTYARPAAAAAVKDPPRNYTAPDTTLTALGVSAAYEVDFWGKNAALVRSADDRLAASRFDVDTVRLTVTAQAATLFLAAASLRDRIRIAENNVVLSRRVAQNIRERVAAGSATVIDLARQDTLVLQQEAAVPRLKQALEEAQLQVAVLLGLPPGRFAVRLASLDRLTLPTLAPGIPTDLLRRRPDIAAAEARLFAAAEDVTAARAAMLPSLTLSGTVGQQSLRDAALFGPGALAFQTVAGLTVPLFDQFRLAAVTAGAAAFRDQLIAAYRQAILSGIGDVEAALVDLRRLREQKGDLEAAVARAREAYTLSDEQLTAGQIDINTVLLTQAAYFAALDDLKQVQLARYQAAVALFRGLGGGWTPGDLLAARTPPAPSVLPAPRAIAADPPPGAAPALDRG